MKNSKRNLSFFESKEGNKVLCRWKDPYPNDPDDPDGDRGLIQYFSWHVKIKKMSISEEQLEKTTQEFLQKLIATKEPGTK